GTGAWRAGISVWMAGAGEPGAAARSGGGGVCSGAGATAVARGGPGGAAVRRWTCSGCVRPVKPRARNPNEKQREPLAKLQTFLLNMSLPLGQLIFGKTRQPRLHRRGLRVSDDFCGL